jgi:hypothetical protein
LFLDHKSKDKSKFGMAKQVMSSGMMEVAGLGVMLDESEKLGAQFQLMVADADSGTQGTLTRRGIAVGRYVNHGGKNIANVGIRLFCLFIRA